jgi:hypothetical protein
MNKFGGSVALAVSSVYPSHEWHVWKFSQVPKGYWEQLSNQRAYFEWLAQQIGVSSLGDWYGVTAATVHKHYGSLSIGARLFKPKLIWCIF